MVATRVDRSSAQAACPPDGESVWPCLDLRAEARESTDHAAPPVGLLRPKLLGTAHNGLPLREAGEQRNQRQLVDRGGNVRGGDLGALQRRRADAQARD